MKTLFKEIGKFVCVLAGAVFVALLIKSYVIDLGRVCESSMEPTYSDGEYLLINRLSYVFSSPKRNDVVICKANINGTEHRYIKRVIGLPGETVEIKEDGYVYINDVKIADPYANEKIDTSLSKPMKITLENKEYFVLGDNRNNSLDSRAKVIGPVSEELIVGKVVN